MLNNPKHIITPLAHYLYKTEPERLNESMTDTTNFALSMLKTLDGNSIWQTPEYDVALYFYNSWPAIDVAKTPLFKLEFAKCGCEVEAVSKVDEFLQLFEYIIYHHIAHGDKMDPIVVDKHHRILDGVKRCAIYAVCGQKQIEGRYNIGG